MLNKENKFNHLFYHFREALLCHPLMSEIYLGVMFDADLSFTSHISNIFGSSFHQIRQLRQIRSSLYTNSAIILANALVTSKLDYRNSFFYSLPATAIDSLQLFLKSSFSKLQLSPSKLFTINNLLTSSTCYN